MANHNPITKLQVNDRYGSGETEVFNIGANFNNIFYNDTNDFSLMDLFNHYIDFLNSNLFAFYSDEDNLPDVDNINIWYDTTERDL